MAASLWRPRRKKTDKGRGESFFSISLTYVNPEGARLRSVATIKNAGSYGCTAACQTENSLNSDPRLNHIDHNIIAHTEKKSFTRTQK